MFSLFKGTKAERFVLMIQNFFFLGQTSKSPIQLLFSKLHLTRDVNIFQARDIKNDLLIPSEKKSCNKSVICQEANLEIFL